MLGRKKLLCWHFQLCHHGFDSLPCLLCSGALGTSPLIQAASNCNIPCCVSCEYAKPKHHSTATATQGPVPSTDHLLKRNELYSRQQVSMDHCKVSKYDSSNTTMSSAQPETMCAGGFIFVDHISGNVHAEHFINFTTMETILAKCQY